MYYTGVGSRSTPESILDFMTYTAKILSNIGYTLRSGHAAGADKAFEMGAEVLGGEMEIYTMADTTPESIEMAKKYHGAWNKLSTYSKRLHGRNSFQVLGRDLKTPSEFLICWTPDGCSFHEERSIKTGGTGTTISIASKHSIVVFNLKNPQHIYLLCGYISNISAKKVI